MIWAVCALIPLWPLSVNGQLPVVSWAAVNGTLTAMSIENGRSGDKVKVAVLGAGSLGKEHVRIYAELAAAGDVEFMGVYDTVAETAQRFAQKYQVRTFGSVAETAAASDAVSIVTPTTTHFELARTLLQQGRHVLLEKPMTDNAAQAAELVQLAQQKHCVLQVGHVERFNPVFKYLESVATDPRFIETHRLSPYPARSTDIGVVLDLMIHDLDVVLAFVKSPVTSVDAVGIPVLSKTEDIANARLRFANGCVANLTASRVSPERMRKIRVFSGGADDQLYVARLSRAGGVHLPHRPGRRGGELAAEEAAPRQGLHHRQPVWREADRARAGADCERGAAEAGVAAFRGVRAGRIGRRSSAENRRSGRWTWRLKSPGRCRQRRSARRRRA